MAAHTARGCGSSTSAEEEPIGERAEPDDGHTVVWYGKSISQRFDGAIRGDDYASTKTLSPEAR